MQRAGDWRRFLPAAPFTGDVVALGAVGVTTLLLFFAQDWIGRGPIDMLYLVPVIASASFFGFRSGLVAAVAAGIAYNFFFLQPVYTFIIYGPANLITAILLVIVAIITGQLAAQARAAAGSLDRIARVVKLTGFVASTPDFTDQPEVVNGCSDLMVEVFGDKGRHARAAVSAAALGYALLISVCAKSTEHAVVLGGGGRRAAERRCEQQEKRRQEPAVRGGCHPQASRRSQSEKTTGIEWRTTTWICPEARGRRSGTSSTSRR